MSTLDSVEMEQQWETDPQDEQEVAYEEYEYEYEETGEGGGLDEGEYYFEAEEVDGDQEEQLQYEYPEEEYEGFVDDDGYQYGDIEGEAEHDDAVAEQEDENQQVYEEEEEQQQEQEQEQEEKQDIMEQIVPQRPQRPPPKPVMQDHDQQPEETNLSQEGEGEEEFQETLEEENQQEVDELQDDEEVIEDPVNVEATAEEYDFQYEDQDVDNVEYEYEEKEYEQEYNPQQEAVEEEGEGEEGEAIEVNEQYEEDVVQVEQADGEEEIEVEVDNAQETEVAQQDEVMEEIVVKEEIHTIHPTLGPPPPVPKPVLPPKKTALMYDFEDDSDDEQKEEKRGEMEPGDDVLHPGLGAPPPVPKPSIPRHDSKTSISNEVMTEEFRKTATVKEYGEKDTHLANAKSVVQVTIAKGKFEKAREGFLAIDHLYMYVGDLIGVQNSDIRKKTIATIRYVGNDPDTGEIIVGVECFEPLKKGSDEGSFKGQQLFVPKVADSNCFFVKPIHCTRYNPSTELLRDQNFELVGWMSKRGTRIKTWKRRWFILTLDNLHYFEGPFTKKELGRVDIAGATIASHSEKPFGFKLILATGKDLFCHGTSQANIDEWTKVLEQTISVASIRRDGQRRLAEELTSRMK